MIKMPINMIHIKLHW